jgi:hypothetical protein
MRTLFFGLVALFLSCAALGQNNLPKWSPYIPSGWKILSATEGKLNPGADANIVLIVEEQDPTKQVKNDGLGQGTLNENDRRLIILDKFGSRYSQLVSINQFLPPEGSTDAPCLADPLMDGGVKIDKGILSIDLHHWLSCGSYGVSHKSYKFRKEAAGFRLIGLEVSEMSRAGGTGTEISVNFLSGRKKITTGIDVFGEDDVAGPGKPKVHWSRVARQSHYLETMNRLDCVQDDKPGWCIN